jgi:hypothetical protein
MTITLREPVDTDWPAILEAADAAVPWATAMNRVWLANRLDLPRSQTNP